ncbi:hypothetical protein FE236_12895 [Mariprofundus erugo]|uniref:Uncharacterized protein n=1 Tax=Mariprofundus erugo TaxID=2528639 RepID=A0A5R9GWP1_9PROT|nr:hypothetical protein [Mariprofundus erugo]TLS68322.1 hypothetical protein FEF65_04855 [Mariprofundus erugo]TLS73677.1 hypothetical protein FE236_12895 [Mariprofundus erugo]
MKLEYAHQIGKIDTNEINWIVEDHLKTAADSAACISTDPQRCMEAINGTCCRGEWDKLIAVYRSESLIQTTSLLRAMEKDGWRCDICPAGLQQSSEAPLSDYYLCVRIRNAEQATAAGSIR